MASIVGVSNISLPPSEAFRPEFDDGADPTLLSDPFAGIFDEVFFSKPSNPAPVGPGEGFAAQLNGQDAGIPADDSARRDSGCILSPYHLDDDDPLLKTTARCSETSGDNDTPEARARREVNLEKNRLAATRCREKRKNWTARLEDRHRQLSAQNKLLRTELAGLHDAVYGLKELVLCHADCGFHPVDEYVAREAERP
ncbi:putative bzip transcription factor [Diplodia seriata]|uniref:Putative bzip transcription factor n=1 Tax=Diplodia seriata TaxID=420778 RepID=A0A0G2GV56_9PEZI|nr:putative bzip transcription factor [Diplodia seriata]